MKDQTKMLTIVTYAVILGSVSILLNDLREFDFNQFKDFQNWTKTADKNASWWTSENALKWSYFAISAGIFFWRGYLIYGFTYFLSVLNEIEKGNYFSTKNISSFKKVGNIFICYAINVFVLKMILAYVQGSRFVALEQLKEGFSLFDSNVMLALFIIMIGLFFIIQSDVISNAKSFKDDSELTI